MRGKHSASTAHRLRDQIRHADEARRRLEQRLHDAERERDELRAWKKSAKRDGLPDLRAEHKRNGDLALRLTQAIDEAHREAQENCDELVAMIFENMRRAKFEPRFTAEQYARIADLCTPGAVERQLSSDPINRQQRRDIARMPPWARATLRDGRSPHDT